MSWAVLGIPAVLEGLTTPVASSYIVGLDIFRTKVSPHSGSELPLRASMEGTVGCPDPPMLTGGTL